MREDDMKSSEVDRLQRESLRAMNSDDQDDCQEEKYSSWENRQDDAEDPDDDESNSDQCSHKEGEID